MDMEKILADAAKTYRLAAESVCENTIGTKVIALLCRDGEISSRDLIAALEFDVANAPSAHGKGRADMDLQRLRAQAAIDIIRETLSARAASPAAPARKRAKRTPPRR